MSDITNNQQLVIKDQRGDTTILLSVLVLSVVLMGVLSASSVILLELKMSRQISDSVPAFFAADAAAEQCLYEMRKSAGSCQNVGGGASVNLTASGATGVASRGSANGISATGTFKTTSRKIELNW